MNKAAVFYGCLVLGSVSLTIVTSNRCDSPMAYCAYRAKCRNLAGTSKSTCDCVTVGFSVFGSRCSDYDECKNLYDPCPGNATCINTAGSYLCLCNEGYTGDGMVACNDIDECQQSLNDCPDHSTCINTEGSYYCQCKTGYLGAQHKCQDIDECLSGVSCHENAVCVNTDGSYSCMCNIGYKLVKDNCVDVNECQESLNQCDRHALCHNTNGSYICACKNGYYGDGTHCFDNEQKAVECTRDGIC